MTKEVDRAEGEGGQRACDEGKQTSCKLDLAVGFSSLSCSGEGAKLDGLRFLFFQFEHLIVL